MVELKTCPIQLPEVTASLHVVLPLLLVKLALLLCGCVLVLLVFGNKVVHVALCLCELHFVHPLTSVPMQESLATEHGCEELCDTLEHFLDCRGVPRERHRHLQALWGDVAD